MVLGLPQLMGPFFALVVIVLMVVRLGLSARQIKEVSCGKVMF